MWVATYYVVISRLTRVTSCSVLLLFWSCVVNCIDYMGEEEEMVGIQFVGCAKSIIIASDINS